MKVSKVFTKILSQKVLNFISIYFFCYKNQDFTRSAATMHSALNSEKKCNSGKFYSWPQNNTIKINTYHVLGKKSKKNGSTEKIGIIHYSSNFRVLCHATTKLKKGSAGKITLTSFVLFLTKSTVEYFLMIQSTIIFLLVGRTKKIKNMKQSSNFSCAAKTYLLI